MAIRDLGTDGNGRDERIEPLTVEASRRRFLRRAAIGGALAAGASVSLPALANAAFAQSDGTANPGSTTPGSTPGSTAGTTPTTTAGKPATVSGMDLVIAQFAQTLELAAEQLYGTIHANGKLSPAATQQARTFQMHHHEHGLKLVEFLVGQALNTPNKALLDQFEPRINNATDEQALARIAQSFEEGLAATYQWAMTQLQEWQLAAAVATILPVDAQHATAWSRTAVPDLASWAASIGDVLATVQPVTGRFDTTAYRVDR